MKFSQLAFLDITTLHAVCIEAPNANLDSINRRIGLLVGEEATFGALGVALTELEKNGFVRTETRLEGGEEEEYVFPTPAGLEKDRTYSVNKPNGPLSFSPIAWRSRDPV